MRKRIISALLCIAMTGTVCASLSVTALADGANVPQYQETAREMEKLNRGLIAVKNTSGVYLAWRLLGDESLDNQAFDIYKNGAKLTTTGVHDATCYTDTAGTVNDKYVVVPAGKDIAGETEVQAEQTKGTDAYTYFEVPISKPTDIAHANTDALSDYTNGANDASLGDLDGDGDYEIVLKWDPVDSKDSNSGNTTGHCVFDAYEIDPNNGGYMWRIDIGNNIAAGAHYSQFMVYDFDGDGRSEMATLTAPGSYALVKNDAGEWEKIYVTTVGDTETIRNADNNATTLRKGNNNGPEYYTIFDGETGKPLYTTDAIPLGREDGGDWGDSKMNRSERYLAAVAYLDGVHPSLIESRGYYDQVIIRAYNWDGEALSLFWEHDGRANNANTMYGQGNHNLSIADIDNDGKDEIVWGSACLDDDGKTVLGNTRHGHGDAIHVSDFNNDGNQEVFSVKEKSSGFANGIQLRNPVTGEMIWSKSVTSDNGRGAMDNIDDAYASTHPDALALGWDANSPGAYDLKGNQVNVKPKGSSRGFCNFFTYWDADLGRELLDDNQMAKYDASTGNTNRIFFAGNVGYLPGSSNNGTKQTPGLVADLWGDWREEIIMRDGDEPHLRIITPTTPTTYRLTTLMHDSQYRLAIAWQNVGYNQPPHTSYYIGSAALATDESGNKLNYLAPATPFTKVKYASSVIENPVTGITLSESDLKLEKGQTATIQAIIEPDNADKKTVTWESSDANVATVSNGMITAVGRGTATITATAKDTTAGTFSATCQVEVYATDVTGINMPGYDNITIMQGGTTKITANVVPSYATVKTINWSSTNPNVATVDSDGVVTGVSSGSTIIRAVTADGGFMGEKVVSVAGNLTDKTGDNEFETTNTDANTTFSGTANSASFKHTEAKAPAEFHKDFEPVTDTKSTLHFQFTTGGDKIDGKYIWLAGHEYNTYIKFLDTEGNNILTVRETHKNGSGTGVSTQYTLGEGGEYNSVSDWKKIADGENNPFNRSQIRWDVTLEIDKAADSATITWAGCNSDFVPDVTHQYTFPLNGATFKTLKYEMDNITDWVSGSPSLRNLSYTESVPTEGVGSTLYDKSTIGDNKWTDADLTDWTFEGTTRPTVDNNRLFYNPTQPSESYSATKTFEIAEGALVTYNTHWSFSSQVGENTENAQYLKFGNIALGWKSDYGVHLSTDGGATWGADVIFQGANRVDYDKEVTLVYDSQNKKVVSLLFDGTPVTLPADLEITEDIKSVSFGFNKAANTQNWGYPNGLGKVTVLQFVEGAEQPNPPAPDIPDPQGDSVKITDVTENKVDISYSTAEAHDSVSLIGALYDGDKLVEVNVKDIANPEATVALPDSLTFEADASKYDVKVFLWNSIDGMTPICAAAVYAPMPDTGDEPDPDASPAPEITE